MYPEVVALSRNSRGELSTIITKIEVTMENSRQAKEEAHDATEDFQSEVLDLSTKQTPSLGPSSTLSRSLSLSSPPLQSKRRRMDPDSDCASSSRESSDFCTNPRTHKTFTDATLDCDVFTPGGVGGAESRSRRLESISPSSTDDEARMGTVDSSSVLRAPDYPSLLPSMPPLHSLSPAAHPIADRLRDIPAFLVGHPLNMAVAAAVGGVNSPLNAFNANCSMGSTLLLDCSASPLRPADCTTARLTPYAASSYFPPSSRRRQKAAAPRSGGRWEAAGSPRPPAASLVDPKAVEDAVIGDGAAGRTTAGSGGDRSQFEERDSAYLERRRKNNEAAKRSRDARRHKEEEIAYRAAKLEQENISLRAELLLLRRESAELHHLLYGRMDPQR